jgi:hypothetical protein
MKEYIVKNKDGVYVEVNPSSVEKMSPLDDWIEVPDGAEFAVEWGSGNIEFRKGRSYFSEVLGEFFGFGFSYNDFKDLDGKGKIKIIWERKNSAEVGESVKPEGGLIEGLYKVEVGSDVSVLTPPHCTNEDVERIKKLVDDVKKPVKSDGGSSSYYFTKLPKHLIEDIVERGGIEIKDIVRYCFDNDADCKDIIKALKRIREYLKGGGKEGVDAIYDSNKISFFAEELKTYLKYLGEISE